MKDKLAEFLKQNKEQILENHTLLEGHEARFENKLNTINTQVTSKFNYWKVAAILIPVLMLSAYYFLEKKPQQSESQIINLAEYSPELDHAENYTSNIVQQKVEKINQLKNYENQIMVDQSLADLQLLQNNYNTLLNDLMESGGNPKVAQSILLNLDLQVKLLETAMQQIQTIQEFKSNPNENNL